MEYQYDPNADCAYILKSKAMTFLEVVDYHTIV